MNDDHGVAADSSSWIRRFHDPDGGAVAAERLVCLPHAGGAASFYLPLSRLLAADLDVVAVQYPGRQDRYRERPLDTVDELVDRLVEVLRDSTDRPLTLFGHSMGATLAFETARRLAPGAGAPLRLVLSGRRSPTTLRPDDVHTRPDSAVLDELRRLGGADMPLPTDPEMLQIVLPAIRADYTAIETYAFTPGPPLDCPVTAVIGDTDPRVTADEARLWAEQTTGPFDLHELPGGHFYLVHHWESIAALLRPVSSR